MLALPGQDPDGFCDRGSTGLGLCLLMTQKWLLLGEERGCPCFENFPLEWPFLLAHLGADFLAPVWWSEEKG